MAGGGCIVHAGKRLFLLAALLDLLVRRLAVFLLEQMEGLGNLFQQRYSTVDSWEGDANASGTKYTREEILDNLASFNCMQIYGNPRWSSAKTFMNFIKSGFRNTVTMKELEEQGCRITLGHYGKDGKYLKFYFQEIMLKLLLGVKSNLKI